MKKLGKKEVKSLPECRASEGLFLSSTHSFSFCARSPVGWQPFQSHFLRLRIPKSCPSWFLIAILPQTALRSDSSLSSECSCLFVSSSFHLLSSSLTSLYISSLSSSLSLLVTPSSSPTTGSSTIHSSLDNVLSSPLRAVSEAKLFPHSHHSLYAQPSALSMSPSVVGGKWPTGLARSNPRSTIEPAWVATIRACYFSSFERFSGAKFSPNNDPPTVNLCESQRLS